MLTSLKDHVLITFTIEYESDHGTQYERLMTSSLIGDTPITECLVRREMFYNQNIPTTKPSAVPGYMFGFVGRSGQAPAFHVMTEEGAQWARVPIHMLCWKECDPIALDLLCWWDCFSNEFSVHTFDFLRNHPCTVYDRCGIGRPGNYLFTIDWCGRFAETPDQHKLHHIIKLDSGHFAAYPNNKINWHDETWIKGLIAKPDWLVNRHSWSVESADRGTLKAPEKVAYE